MTFDLTPEQLRRAQVRGGQKRGHYGLSFNRKRILELIGKRPMLAQELSLAIDKKPAALVVMLKAMLIDKQLIIIGTAEQLTRPVEVSTRRNANVYALPGTPRLEGLATFGTSKALPESPYRQKNIAARREPWPVRELHRDFFAHRKLAMLVRK